MRRILPIVIVFVVGGLGAAVYWSVGRADGSRQQASSPGAAAATSSRPAATAGPLVLPERSAMPPAADDRASFVEGRVQTLLDAYPDVAKLASVTCEVHHCRVELEVKDMKKFTPAYERLQDTTFIGVAKGILLATPEPLADGTHRVEFTLEFAAD